MSVIRNAASILVIASICLATPAYATSFMTAMFAYDSNDHLERLTHLWLPLFVFALLLSFLSARYIPQKETFGLKLYRESPWRYVFVWFCCTFTVLAIIEDLGVLVSGRSALVPLDKFVLAACMTVGNVFHYWLLSHNAGKSANATAPG